MRMIEGKMVFEELDEFCKDLKILLKRYRSLNDDLLIVKKVLEILPDDRSLLVQN